MKKILVAGLACWAFAQTTAHSLTVVPNPVSTLAADDYEKMRLEKVKNAATYEEFLQWATPEEIAEDLGIDPNEASNLVEDASDPNYIVRVNVHLASQTLDATGPDIPAGYRVPVATGRPGHTTPAGCHVVAETAKMHISKKYHAPMPYSTVFLPSVYIALHVGSVKVRSHGCVHLRPQDALLMYNEANRYPGQMMVCVTQ